MDNSFQLESSEHERIYSKIIEPTSFLDTSSVDKPRLVIVAAQTGAGKSKLVTLSLQEFSDGNVVTVNTDELRAYHPHYDEVVMLDDTRSAERTHHDASSWKNKLLRRCVETRRNIVLEGVFKDSKSLLEVIELAKHAGYMVVLRVVASHERFSVWGIKLRYEGEKKSRGHGRYVPIEYHNECYQSLLDSIAAAERQKVADSINVYDRNGAMLYSNTLHNGDWKDAPKAVAAVEQGRDRKLTKVEQRQYKESWSKVFEYMHQRGACSDEIDRVKELAERFLMELEDTGTETEQK